MTNNEIIKEIKPEVDRFMKIFKECSKSDIDNYRDVRFAKLKRASLDLKKELTKLTQASKYKWGN